MPKRLTDKGLQALKRADAGETYDVADSVVPNLIVWVSPRGRRTFALYTRFPNTSYPARRTIGKDLLSHPDIQDAADHKDFGTITEHRFRPFAKRRHKTFFDTAHRCNGKMQRMISTTRDVEEIEQPGRGKNL